MASSRDKLLSQHFEYNQLIEVHYKERNKNAKAIDQCIRFCLADIQSIDKFVQAWLEEERILGKQPRRIPHIPSFERLAIIYEKQGKLEDAIKICEQAIQLGLDDEKKCYSPSDFGKRIEKLKTKLSKLQTTRITSNTLPKQQISKNKLVTKRKSTDERGIPVRWVNAPKLASRKGKALYTASSGQPVVIEQFVLEHYATLGWSGLITENNYWWNYMGLLFWDVIFAKLPNAFKPELSILPSQQDMPLDFFTSDFYSRREKIILKRINELTQPKMFGIQKPDIEKEVRLMFKKNYGRPCRPIVWDKFTLDELTLAAKILSHGQIVKIMHRLLQNFVEYRSGLPDLFLSSGEKALFVEVKSEAEKVSEHQFTWLEFLQNQIGVNVEICRISAD